MELADYGQIIHYSFMKVNLALMVNLMAMADIQMRELLTQEDGQTVCLMGLDIMF